MLQKIPCPVENLCTEKLDVGPRPHVFGKDFEVMHDRCVVPIDDSPNVGVGVEVFRVGNVCEDGPGQDEFLGLDVAGNVVRVNSDDLCGIAENGS